MGTPDRHFPHDAPRSAEPADSRDTLATPQGVEDRGGIFGAAELSGLVNYWGNRERRKYGCRKVLFLDGGVPVGVALFTRKGISLSLYDGTSGGQAFLQLEDLAAQGKSSYRAFREVLEPASLQPGNLLSAEGLRMESTRLRDDAKKLASVQSGKLPGAERLGMESARPRHEAGPPSVAASPDMGKKEPVEDRLGYFWDTTELLELLQFWAKDEFANEVAAQSIGRRRVDFSEGRDLLGSVWFGPSGFEAAESFLDPESPSRPAEPRRRVGWEALCAIVASCKQGKRSYRGFRHALPPSPEEHAIKAYWGEGGGGTSAISLLFDLDEMFSRPSQESSEDLTPSRRFRRRDGVVVEGVPGGETVLRGPDGAEVRVPASVGAPLGWFGDLLVTQRSGLALFIDPRDDFRMVSCKPLSYVLSAPGAWSDEQRMALRVSLRSAMAERVDGAKDAPAELVPFADFTRFGYATFIRKGRDGRWVRHVVHISGKVVPTPAGAVISHDGGMIWAEFPATGTTRFLGAKGEFDPRSYVRIARAGAMPLWTLERAPETSSGEPLSIIFSTASIIRSILPDDDVDDEEKEASLDGWPRPSRVQVANARLELRDVPSEHELAVLDPQFWDGPLEGAAEEWRDDVLAWASS